jgi:hypothetical protein
MSRWLRFQRARNFHHGERRGNEGHCGNFSAHSRADILPCSPLFSLYSVMQIFSHLRKLGKRYSPLVRAARIALAKSRRRYPRGSEKMAAQHRHQLLALLDQAAAGLARARRASTIAHTFSTSAPIRVADAAANAPKELIADAHTSRAASAPKPTAARMRGASQ